MRTRPRRLAKVAAALALLAPAAARAERFEFAAGGVVDLPAEFAGDRVVLETPLGPLAFDRADFRSIGPGDDPARHWPDVRSKAMQGTAADRHRAAVWALERGLTGEGEAMVRAAREADPGHAPTARMAAALDALDGPRTDPDLGAVRDAFRVPLRVARTDHVVLLHQHDDEEARARAEVLERVVATFHLLMAADGFELRPPRERLPSVWLTRREDYLAYLAREDALAFRGTRGHFHPARGVVATYDPRGDRWYRRAAASLESSGGADDPDRRRRRLLLELERSSHDLGTAAHETVHQLVLASGLARRLDDLPRWLHEGLAAQFEVVENGRWRGVGGPNPLREVATSGRRPMPLLRLIRDEAGRPGYDAAVYHDAWSLTRYLRAERREDFNRFVDLLRLPGPSTARDVGDRAESALRRAFGPDLRELERGWRSHREASRVARRD